MEIRYPYKLGGEMLEGYQNDDPIMAQVVVNAACESATVLERERIIKLLKALATHKDCQLGEHHEDYVWNSPLGIIEVLTKWDSEPIALIKGEQK